MRRAEAFGERLAELWLQQFCDSQPMRRIPQRELRNDVSEVLRRVMGGERLRVTVSGRDAADLVPIDDASSWTAGARARQLISSARADPELSSELDGAFGETTDQL